MRITFCGGAGTVTGSCHLVEAAGLRVLLDCGLFQGREAEGHNREAFPFDPHEIDVLVLSHAHLDHIGLVPRLVREGFHGEIVSTPATAEIAKVVLTDAAHLQVEESAYHARKARRRGEELAPPLYDVGDVLDALEFFRVRVAYDVPVRLGRGVEAVLHDAGHVLGSAAVEVRAEGKTVLYSGDLGSPGRPIVRDPSDPPRADVVLVESTYGNREHRSLDSTVAELADALRAVIGGGGNLLVPSFALERTQEVLYELFSLWKRREIPACRIHLDSPLAIATTRVFSRHVEEFDDEGREAFSREPNPFSFPLLHYVETAEDSKRLNAIQSGNVLIAGSGMCTGGRIVHHLRHNLWRAACGVLFVGYQAQGTLGRAIVDGARRVSLFGEEVAVRARVFTVNGFSAHAGQSTLLDWVSKSTPGRVVLVHGEPEGQEGLAAAIQGRLGIQPEVAQRGAAIEV